MDEADSAEGDSTAGVELMDQMVLGGAGFELILQHPEDLGRDLFEFKFRSISQAAFALDLFDVAALQEFRKEFPLAGEGLLDGPDDFGNRRAATASETYQVTIAGDIDPSPVVGPLDRSGFVGGKKFRMDRSSEDIQCVFRNRWTNG